MNNTNKICPYCGTLMIEKKIPFNAIIGYGKAKVFLSNYICPNCKYEEGDSRQNDKLISSATNMSLNICARKILTNFRRNKKSFSEIERKFYLPYKTLSKWLNENTKPSAAAVELLRIIYAYPWIEDAADVGFESEEAQEIPRKYYLELFNTPDISCFYGKDEDYQYATFRIKNLSKNFDKNLNLEADDDVITFNTSTKYQIGVL